MIYAPKTYWEASGDDKLATCNGCGAKDGVKIMIGLMPVFALAAFFEGFITRLYNDVSFLTTAIFALSVVFVIWYFIIYPIRLSKKFAHLLNEEEV